MNQWFDDCDNYGIDSPEWYQPYANEIGRKIREQRKRKGMSQTQLANVMGTDRNSISRMESGVRAFRMDTLGLLHLTLSVPVTVLLPEEWMAGTLEAECMKLTEEQRAVVQSAVMGVIKALKAKMT